MLLAAALAGRDCSDDAVARSASLPVAIVRDVIPTILERCQHVPALLATKANRTPAGIIFSAIRLTGEATREDNVIKNGTGWSRARVYITNILM